MPVLKQELTNNCGPAKTHMVQYDIPGTPRPGSKWLVTIQMTSNNGDWPYGGYTQLVVFPTNLQNGKNRGLSKDGCYISWYKNGASCNGYTTLVDEDGERSKFKVDIGRKIVSKINTSQAGAVLTVSFTFTLSESGAGLSFAVLGGQHSGYYNYLKVTFVGTTVDQ